MKLQGCHEDKFIVITWGYCQIVVILVPWCMLGSFNPQFPFEVSGRENVPGIRGVMIPCDCHITGKKKLDFKKCNNPSPWQSLWQDCSISSALAMEILQSCTKLPKKILLMTCAYQKPRHHQTWHLLPVMILGLTKKTLTKLHLKN